MHKFLISAPKVLLAALLLATPLAYAQDGGKMADSKMQTGKMADGKMSHDSKMSHDKMSKGGKMSKGKMSQGDKMSKGKMSGEKMTDSKM